MDDKETQFTIREIVDDLVSKKRGYRDFAVFLLPQKNGNHKFSISFRVGRLDEQEITDLDIMIRGMDLYIDYQASGITEDRQRIVLFRLERKPQKKSTPEPKRINHSIIDQETGKQEMQKPQYRDEPIGPWHKATQKRKR